MGGGKGREEKKGGKNVCSLLANFLSSPLHSSLLPIRDNGSFLRIVYYIFQTGHDELRARREIHENRVSKRMIARRYISGKLLFHTWGDY